jgi:hypothetical protein
LALLVQLAGCGVGQEIADPVDPELAQRTLRDVLDAWAAGTRPEELRQKTPEVVVQDFDWSAGSRLVSFEVKAPGSPQDANLFCDVKLVLEDASRRKVERLVTYCVGTDPVLTVFRAPGS